MTEIVKHIVDPDPHIARIRAYNQAKAGEYPRTNCPHPISAIAQFYDENNTIERHDRPTNLFECTICHSLLWLIDPYGRNAAEPETRFPGKIITDANGTYPH